MRNFTPHLIKPRFSNGKCRSTSIQFSSRKSSVLTLGGGVTNKNNGLILIISLWILAIVSLLCISLASRVMINLKLVRFQRDRMKCLYIAKAAVQKAINVIENDSTPETDILNELWSRGYDEDAPGNGYIFKDAELADGVFTVSYIYGDTNSESPVYFYGMSDEDRKVNINHAERELLESLFDLMGVDNPETLSENVIYWRGDAAEGYTDPYYESSQIPYSARKADLKSIEELSLVNGFRDNLDLVKEYERFFTIYTEYNLININTAPWQVLKAVFISLGADSLSPGLSDRLVNNVIDFRNGDDNQEATDDDVAINTADIKTVLKTNIVNPVEINWIDSQVFPFTVKANLFRIEVMAELNKSKIKKKLTTIIDRSGPLYKAKYWHEE